MLTNTQLVIVAIAVVVVLMLIAHCSANKEKLVPSSQQELTRIDLSLLDPSLKQGAEGLAGDWRNNPGNYEGNTEGLVSDWRDYPANYEGNYEGLTGIPQGPREVASDELALRVYAGL